MKSRFQNYSGPLAIIRWPGKIPAGKDNDKVITTMDLLPTFAKLAGAEIPTDRVIDGKDIWPTLIGEAGTPHEEFFYHRGNSLNAVRSGKWNLHVNNGKPTQLYDLEDDLKQTRNIYREHAEVVKELTALLESYTAPKQSSAPVTRTYDAFQPLGTLDLRRLFRRQRPSTVRISFPKRVMALRP